MARRSQSPFPGTRPLRYAAALIALVATFGAAGAALATVQTYYSETLSPGGFASTPGWNNRDWKASSGTCCCRS